MPNKTCSGLDSKIAVVTGAGRGLGATIARELADRGALVAVVYHRSFQPAKDVVRDIEARGGRAVAVQADVRDAEQCAAMVAEVTDTLGAPEIMVLNATGFPDMLRGPALKHSLDEYTDYLVSHFRASLAPLYAVLPGMTERGRGSVVYISDAFARRTAPKGLGHALPKATVETVMKHLAVELGPAGIRVNAVVPGAVRSDGLERAMADESVAADVRAHIEQIPLGRVAEPEEVARAVAMLASDEFGYVTGAFLPVAGGSIVF
ncbi:SDR family NAD(P)-dependent oxidoreductase [Kitasatospora sp. NBC_01302]|uniref:SDR family NAD(P)-dependent oxidoreductase n=1 Tax=Kitasatospora sp. NBC_01302 TaxID=2903575 RepID=UPI002E15EC72|nr:SDR family oxidoreductase [Kitasatospora sp. NBC_01302]